VNPEDGDRFAQAFLRAAQSGDTADLRKLLAVEAVMQSDGGGVKLAAVHAIEGPTRSRTSLSAFSANLTSSAWSGPAGSTACQV